MVKPQDLPPRRNAWKPIDDLPVELFSLTHEDLAYLAQIWREQAERLKSSEALRRFNDRLRREWAIETGIIEGLYSLDRGVTQLLIERGIEASLIPHGSTDRPVSEILPLLHDQEAALEGLFDFVAQRRQLSASYIRELHQLLTRAQETTTGIDSRGHRVNIQLSHGAYKLHHNNPTRSDGTVHEYCPPEHVAAEMDHLIDLHAAHEASQVAPEISAAWLHHRFTQIHPFQDGNGRVARAIASLVFLKAGWFPLVINRDQRDEYIDALEAADKGELSPLVNLFARVEKQAFLRALSLSEDALREKEPISQVIAQATDRLRRRQVDEVAEMRAKAFDLSSRLESLSEERLREVCTQLSRELKSIKATYECRVDRSTATTDHFFKRQIVETARALGYYADTRTYRAWVRLRISEERETDLVLSFHSLGTNSVGIFAAAAFVEYRDRDENQTTTDGPYPASEEVFQFSYREPEEGLRDRFDAWLSRVILLGLDLWRRQL